MDEMDEKMALLQRAFPDQEWDEDRLAAMEEFVYSCGEGPMMEDEEEGPPRKAGGPGVVLAFGGGKK